MQRSKYADDREGLYRKIIILSLNFKNLSKEDILIYYDVWW